jgi:hypothetical protein
MSSRGATTGPLFAHKRRYHQDQHDFGYIQLPISTQQRSTRSSNYALEQPFMVDHGYGYSIEAMRRHRYQ